jgi:ribosomal protein S18 acetylase RimI-like enzyme
VIVRSMSAEDIADVAAIHASSFPRQTLSREWVDSNLRAFPKVMVFVADANDCVAGYIFWTQRSGFRPEVVLELEQIAVRSDLRRRGIAQILIKDSLTLVREQLTRQGAILKHIIVSTRVDNSAQALYRTVLDAEVEATIRNLYSADEVVMISRNPQA